MKKYAKIFALMMSLVLVIGVLSACSLMGPKNAKECFEKNLSASAGLESYHMDVDMEMGMNMSFSDPTMAAQFEEVMGVKAFDIIGLDYILITKTQFFQHYIPETKGCAGYHSFGYNRKEQLRQILTQPFAALLIAWICTLF